jgi:NADH:ubiquinone oxidoreductase subunit K
MTVAVVFCRLLATKNSPYKVLKIGAYTMDIISIALLVVAFLLIIMGLYGLLRTRNIIRLILAIAITVKAVILLLAIAGIASGNLALVQTFIVTLIVVELVMVLAAVGVAIGVYRQNGNIDINHLTKLKG